MIKIIELIKTFFSKSESQLDDLEQVPVIFGIPNQNNKHLALLKDQKGPKQKLLALYYRLELSPLKFNRRIFDAIREEALAWKEEHPLMPIKTLSLIELKELEKVAYHDEFANLLFKDESLKNQLFNWILRDQNDAIIFIQFPALVKRLNSCNLNGRISCHGGLNLEKRKIGNGPAMKKVVTLPFEGRPINILDENTIVHFRGNVTMTIAEVFNIFKGKDYRVDNLEFMKDGIINWNIHHLGYWDNDRQCYVQVDLEQEEWWRQLPFFEVLTQKQVRMRYGWEVNGSTWVAAASATRGLASLSYEQTHAFLELAIPIGKGLYGIYDFGKLAYKYPSSFFEMMDMFCKNVHATIAFPDENVFYSHRQHALHPFCINDEQGRKLMELIKQDIEVARRYNLVYQIESENCAKWVQLKLEAILGKAIVPNLYRMQLLNTEPEGPISKIFAFIKKLPENWQVPLLTTLHLPLGAAKRTWVEENGIPVAKSLREHTFFRTGEVYLPAFMHNQLLNGSLKCPLGLQDAYFVVGLLSDKHKFGFIKSEIIDNKKFAIDKDNLLLFLNREDIKPEQIITPLRL